MNTRGWLNELMEAPEKRAFPILSFPCVSLLGITVRDLISDPELQAEGMRRVAERIPSAASVSMMDLSVEAEAFGAKIRVSDNEVPTVVGAIVADEDDTDALKVPQVGAGRTGLYVDAIHKAAALIQDRPVFAGVIGPFSLAGRLIGVTDALVLCLEEPDLVHTVLEKCTEFCISYARAYNGAAGVVMAEPLTGLLSPGMAAEFSAPYVKRIVDAVQRDDFQVIYHNCGGGTIQQIDSILSIGAAAYHFGNAISMTAMLEKVPEDVLVMGNVDPAGQFCRGTPQSIRSATLELLETCAGHRNFVISSGCDVPPATPWENIDAFFAAVDEYRGRE